VSKLGLGSFNSEQGKPSDLLCIMQWSLETLRRSTPSFMEQICSPEGGLCTMGELQMMAHLMGPWLPAVPQAAPPHSHLSVWVFCPLQPSHHWTPAPEDAVGPDMGSGSLCWGHSTLPCNTNTNISWK